MRRVGKDWPSEMDVTLGVYSGPKAKRKEGIGRSKESGTRSARWPAIRRPSGWHVKKFEVWHVTLPRRVEGGSRVGDCLSSPNLCPWLSEGFCDDGESA